MVDRREGVADRELPFEDRLARVETAAYPVGVLLLAAGRLLSVATLATAGGLLVAGGAAVAGGALLRRLRDATAAATPMLSRYAVVAGALLFAGNMAATVARHGGTAMLGGSGPTATPETTDASDR